MGLPRPLTAALVAKGFDDLRRSAPCAPSAPPSMRETDTLTPGLHWRFAGDFPRASPPRACTQSDHAGGFPPLAGRQLTKLVAVEKALRFAPGLRCRDPPPAGTRGDRDAGGCLRPEAPARPAISRRSRSPQARSSASIPGIGGRLAGVVIADMPELEQCSTASPPPALRRHGARAGQAARPAGARDLRPAACLRAAFYVRSHGRRPLQCHHLEAAYPRHARRGKPPQGRHRRHQADASSPSPTPSSARTRASTDEFVS